MRDAGPAGRADVDPCTSPAARTPTGEKQVLYSNTVTRIDGACRLHECVLMVTERALYTIQPGSYRLKRRIDLKVHVRNKPACAHPGTRPRLLTPAPRPGSRVRRTMRRVLKRSG